MKLERLDIGSAMGKDEEVEIDVQRDWPQLEADLKDKTLQQSLQFLKEHQSNLIISPQL